MTSSGRLAACIAKYWSVPSNGVKPGARPTWPSLPQPANTMISTRISLFSIIFFQSDIDCAIGADTA